MARLPPSWVREAALLCFCVTLLILLYAGSFNSDETQSVTDARSAVAEQYTHRVGVEEMTTGFGRYGTILYGDVEPLRTATERPMLPSAIYTEVVKSMPILCVDVALQAADGSILLVKRHAEPVKGVYWWPGGRMLMGETFAEAAIRKVKKEIGLNAVVCQGHVLGVWNTFFERSAWGGATQTVNILVHLGLERRHHAAQPPPELRICGDQPGKCKTTAGAAAAAEYGEYRWVSPTSSDLADASFYVKEGMDALMTRRTGEDMHGRGMACDDPPTNSHDEIRKPHPLTVKRSH